MIVRLARLIRWAIVASGTTNALAICAVVRPPTARRVRAILRRAVARPLQHRRQQRLLDRVFAEVKAAVPADERREHLRRQWTHQRLDVVSAAHLAAPAAHRTFPPLTGGFAPLTRRFRPRE